MDCERAANLTSAKIDGELAPGEVAELDAHLAGCAGCRAATEAAEVQDAAMMRAFAGRRNAAAALAERVAGEFDASRPPASGSPWRRWAGVAVAAAAGFVVAVALVRPRPSPTPPAIAPPTAPESPIVAQLALVSGEVFTCPSGGDAWERTQPGTGLEAGAKIRTADAAKCEVTLPGGSRVRLNSDTELQIAGGGDVLLTGGQIWSAVTPTAGPLRIVAGGAKVTTAAPAAQVDVARARSDDVATVTVVNGAARVDRGGDAGDARSVTVVPGGQFLRVGGPPFMGCEPLADPVQTTRWLDDLLLLQSPDSPELLDRVDALLARIVAEREASSSEVGPVEHDVRARGSTWAAATARYACTRIATVSQADRDKRRVAVRLLADLATPACVEDLIALLADEDGDVRYHAAAALNRVTGQTLGFTPDACGASPRDPAPAAAWKQWLTRHRGDYPGRS